MTHYAQVTDNGQERLGSFARMILDGRDSWLTMIENALWLQDREGGSGVRVVRSSRFVDTDLSRSRVIFICGH
jgi:hypothetical protein